MTELEVVDSYPERGVVDELDPQSFVVSLLHAQRRASRRSVSYLANTVTGRRTRSFAKRGLDGPSPMPLPAGHAVLDEVIKVYFQTGRTPLSVAQLYAVERDVEALIAHQQRYAITAGTHHLPPPPPTDASLNARATSLRFTSGWVPHDEAPGGDEWLSDGANDTVRAQLVRRHEGAAPWLILVHGAEMGRNSDARILRAQRLAEQLDVNVVMPVLPKHGPRRSGSGRGEFPSLDIVANVHGLTQAVWDVRRTIAWIREQEATAIGAFGFSLGGNVVAQLASVEPELDALVPSCPAVDLVDLIQSNMPSIRRRNDRVRTLFDRSRLACQVINPLHQERSIDRDKITVLTAGHDRLADPIRQVGRLWEHWERPELEVIPAGHVSYMLRARPTEAVVEAFRQRGVCGDRPPG